MVIVQPPATNLIQCSPGLSRFWLILLLPALMPVAAQDENQDLVNVTTMISQDVTCDCANYTPPPADCKLRAAEIDFKNFRMKGKRRKKVAASSGETIDFSAELKYKKRAIAQVTSVNDDGSSGTKVMRIKPEVPVTHDVAWVDSGNNPTQVVAAGEGLDSSFQAPTIGGIYMVTVTYRAADPDTTKCIQNGFNQSETFELTVMSGPTTDGITAVKIGNGCDPSVPTQACEVMSGDYLCKNQGQVLELTLDLSDSLADLDLGEEDIVWQTTPPEAGEFVGGDQGQTVTWQQKNSGYVSHSPDDVVIEAITKGFDPSVFKLTVVSIGGGVITLQTNKSELHDTSYLPGGLNKNLLTQLVDDLNNFDITYRAFPEYPPTGGRSDGQSLMEPIVADPIVTSFKFLVTGSDVAPVLQAAIDTGSVAGKIWVNHERIIPIPMAKNTLDDTRIEVHKQRVDVVVEAEVFMVDVDVDSDNNSPTEAPQGDQAEELVEDGNGVTGKFVIVNGDDGDNDGLPDYVDGFDWLPGTTQDDTPPTAAQGENFTPVEITLNGDIDFTKATLGIDYDAADPLDSTKNGTALNTVYSPAVRGHLRLWTKNGNVVRDARSFDDDIATERGDYVPPTPGGSPYNSNQISLLGFTNTSRKITLYAEGIKQNEFVGNTKVRVTLDPDGSGPASECSDTIALTVILLDLDVDTNRDAIVQQNNLDDSMEQSFSKDRGAIFMVNYDSDDPGSSPDSISFMSGGEPDIEEDLKINGPDDVRDIGHLIVRGPGPKQGLKFLLRADAEDLQAVHIFQERVANEHTLWGGWNAHKGDSGQKVMDITNTVVANTDKNLGIEALYFRNQTHPLPSGKIYTFDGKVEITLVVQTDPGGRELATDTVQLRVAPYLLTPNTWPAQEVWLTKNHGANDIAAKLGTIAKRPVSPDQWFQDHVQIGFTSMPGQAMHISLRLPYEVMQHEWPEQLLSTDRGLYRFRNTLVNDSPSPGSGDYGGNLELLPSSDDWPLGRIALGSTMGSRLTTFLEGQGTVNGGNSLQSPISLDVDWLRVGHVDEIMGFIPDGQLQRGYKVAMANPTYGEALLRNGDPLRDIEPPANGTPIFHKGAWASGRASNEFTTHDKAVLFDGVAHGYITCIPKNDINDGETVSIKDGPVPGTGTLKVFEFDTNHDTQLDNISVDLRSANSASDVRDVLMSAINGAGFGVKGVADGENNILLYHQEFGTGKNQDIEENVVKRAFKVRGMQGGAKAENGQDFTAYKDGYIRLYRGKGAGQVAKIWSGNKGWCRVKSSSPAVMEVFNTGSRVVWNSATGQNGLFYYFGPYAPANMARSDRWITEPKKNSTHYVVVKNSQMLVGPNFCFPALNTVYELKEEDVLWFLNSAAQKRITSVHKEIVRAMGNVAGTTTPFLRDDGNQADDSLFGDSDDDFIRIPAIFFGRWHTFLTDRHNTAYLPNMVNFQPIHTSGSGLQVVFPDPFGPESGNPVDDIYKKALGSIMGRGAIFADDWDLYHRLDGEVHCATAVHRKLLKPEWWKEQH